MSKLSSAALIWYTSPTVNVRFARPCVSDASAITSADESMATTDPSGATRSAISAVMVPGPHPTSSTRRPRCRCGARYAAEFSIVRQECERSTLSWCPCVYFSCGAMASPHLCQHYATQCHDARRVVPCSDLDVSQRLAASNLASERPDAVGLVARQAHE